MQQKYILINGLLRHLIYIALFIASDLHQYKHLTSGHSIITSTPTFTLKCNISITDDTMWYYAIIILTKEDPRGMNMLDVYRRKGHRIPNGYLSSSMMYIGTDIAIWSLFQVCIMSCSYLMQYRSCWFRYTCVRSLLSQINTLSYSVQLKPLFW